MTNRPGTDCTNSQIDQQLNLPLPFWAPSRAKRIVWKHNRRAGKRGLPATLTAEQWQARIAETGGKCYFCPGSAESMEHVVPMHRGGGTTYENCVPCCIKCNEIRNYVGHAALVLDNPIVADLLPRKSNNFEVSMMRSTRILIVLSLSLLFMFISFMVMVM